MIPTAHNPEKNAKALSRRQAAIAAPASPPTRSGSSILTSHWRYPNHGRRWAAAPVSVQKLYARKKSRTPSGLLKNELKSSPLTATNTTSAATITLGDTRRNGAIRRGAIWNQTAV